MKKKYKHGYYYLSVVTSNRALIENAPVNKKLFYSMLKELSENCESDVKETTTQTHRYTVKIYTVVNSDATIELMSHEAKPGYVLE